MFSHRVPASLEPNRLTRALSRRRREARPLLDLTVSNPTCADIEYPAALLAPLADPQGLRYAPSPFGLEAARAAVVEDFARRGLTVAVDHVALTASTSEAYSLIFKLLCDPDDEVLIPRPSYPLFDHLTRLDAVRAVPYDLEYHGRWLLDLDAIRGACTPRTRALLIVNPNNPTGSFVSTTEFDALAEFCASHQIAMVSDEVFADYPLIGSASNAGHLTQRNDVLGFTLGGLSKSIGLPQAKLAWIAISGATRDVSGACARLELIADTYLSVSTPVQLAAAALLSDGALVRTQIQQRTRANLDTLERLVAAAPACGLLRAEGGWSAVVRVPSIMSEEDLVLSLLEDDVLVHPGYFFDFASETFVVVSLLTPPPDFVEGTMRVLRRFPEGSVS